MRAGGLRRLAERTPASRERFIDLLRAVAIVAVVLGHWLITVVGYQNGQLTGRSALPDLRWAFPLTWLVQVMPLFFLVGGYANAASLTSHRRRGGDAGDWLIRRGGRLVRPSTTLVLVLVGGSLAARIWDADPTRIRLVVWTAAIPLWFLSAYLGVVALAPAMYALHRRYGIAVPAVLVGLVALGDAARFVGDESWASGSFLFGWLAIHQMGFFWHDGRLPTRRRTALTMLLGALVALLLLTVVGPYPISMINVPGERPHNMSPPSLALLTLATAQLAMALLIGHRVERWLHRTRLWLVTVAINAVILTVFLWHMSAAILLVGALSTANLLPTSTAGSAAWWAWRAPWVIMLTAVLGLLVAIFGPIEIRGYRPPRRRPPWLPAGLVDTVSRPRPKLTLALIGFAAAAFGLLDNNLLPRTEPAPFGIPAVALIAYLAGAVVLRLLRGLPPAGHSAQGDNPGPQPDPTSLPPARNEHPR